MRVITSCLTLVWCCCLPLLAWSAQPVVRMALEQNPPLAFVTPDGKPEGLFVDLMNEVARREGWQMQYFSCPQGECLAKLTTGEADFMAPLAWSPERAEQFLFSASDVVTNWGVVYSRPNAHFQSFFDLAGKRVGGVPNDIHFIRLKEQLKAFGIKSDYRDYPNFDTAFNALQKGDVDAAVVGRFFAMKRAAAYSIEATPIIFNPIHVHLAASPTINSALLTAFNRQLEQLKAEPDSAYYRALEKWLTPKRQATTPLWLWYLLISLLAISLAMITFILLLRQTVQRKTAELQASYSLLQAVQDNTFQFQGLLSPDGTLLDANRSALELIGANKHDLIGKKFWDTPWWCNDPTGQEKLRHCISRCAAGETVRFEARHTAADNRIVLVDFSLRPIRHENGELIYLVPEGHDITALRQLETSLLQKNSFLNTLFDSIPFDLWVRDQDRRLVLQNSHYRDHYQTSIGNTPEEDGLPTEIIRSWNLLYQQAFDGYTVDLDVRETGKIFHKLMVPIKIDGQINQILGLNIDRTQQLQTMEALRQSEKRFKAIFDESPFIITLKDTRNDTYLDVNQFFCKFSGIPKERVIGKHPTEIGQYVAPEEHAGIREQLNREGSVTQREIKLQRADGETRHGLVSCRIVRLGETLCNLTVIQDITDLKQAENSLYEAREREREIMIQHEKMLMISGLAAGMAHEINNPLGVIAQDLQNLERRLSPALPKNRQIAEELGICLDTVQQYMEQREVKTYLASMQDAARRASRIMDNMLQFSRSSGTVRHPAPLFEVIEHALELAASDTDLRKLYSTNSIRLIRDYTSDLPIVTINVTEIEQVLINLLKNAAQAISCRQGTQHGEIRISARQQDAAVVIALADNGPGMGEEVRRRIFEPFFTTKDIGKGTGLGLSVSHAIITRNHKGLLQVSSTPGQGSCFTITLPLEQD